MMTFTRKYQTFLLIVLTAATLMPSYSLQGWLAGGHSASDLPFWFWVWETVAWSARALIEAGAILFLFETNAQTETQERALLMFKVMLIALITLTLGVVVASAGLGQSIADALPRPLYWLWSFAVASYAPLMLGSVGMAYRIQPHDTPDMTQHEKVVAVTHTRPVTQRRKEIVSSQPEPIVSRVVDPLPDPSKDAPDAPIGANEPDDDGVDPRVVIPQLLQKVLQAETPKEKQKPKRKDDTLINLENAMQVVLSVADDYGATDGQIEQIRTGLEGLGFPMTLDTLISTVRDMATNNGVPEFVMESLLEKIATNLKQKKLWNDLSTLEAQHLAYSELKTTTKLNDDEIAAQLGCSRSTLSRMKTDYSKKYPPLVSNGNGHAKEK